MADTAPIVSTAPIASTTPATTPKMGWVKTKDADKRPPLPHIADEAKKDFEPKGWANDHFENVKQYALGNGNPTISKHLKKLTPEQTQVYLDTAKEVFLAHCDKANWKDGNPVRPPIVEIVDAATAKFKAKGWSIKPLDNVKEYVQKTGNPTISGHMSRMNQEQTKAYLSTVTRVFAQSCGYEWQEIKDVKVEEAAPVAEMSKVTPAEVMTISDVKPYWAEPGKEIEIALTGKNFKLAPVTKVVAPEPFKDLGLPTVSDDGTSMTFPALSLPVDAAPGIYEIELYTGDKGDQKLVSFSLAVTEMTGRQFSDGVRKMHIKLDANTGLVAGANGYAALGLYEEPVTVNNFGLAGGVAPQVIGQDGYVKSEKQELNFKLDGDIALRGYRDDSSMMGARLGADYRYQVHPAFTPEVYANGSVRKTTYKNPTPQYFSGSVWEGSAGLAVNSRLANWAAARAYFGMNLGQATIDESYLGYDGFTSFTDNSRALETGLKLQLGQAGQLNGEAHFDYKQGYHQAPDRANIAGVWYDFGPTYETVNILSVGAKAALGDKLRLGYDYTARRYQGWWDAVDIHHIGVGTSYKGNSFDLNIDLRPKSNFKSLGPVWSNKYASLGVSVVSLDGHAGVAVGGGLNLYSVAEEVFGTRRPVYKAAEGKSTVTETETAPAADTPATTEPASTEPASTGDPGGID